MQARVTFLCFWARCSVSFSEALTCNGPIVGPLLSLSNVAKCNLGSVKHETRLRASSLSQSGYGVAGGFVQGHLDFTARFWM